jgi:hypothetical protein
MSFPRRSPGDGRPRQACDRLPAVYVDLIDADDQGDVQALARVAWDLFTLASEAHQAHREAVVVLDELCTAARAAAAGKGSPASLALLRIVLARRGWLPPPSATPLQVLASPGMSQIFGH